LKRGVPCGIGGIFVCAVSPPAACGGGGGNAGFDFLLEITKILIKCQCGIDLVLKTRNIEQEIVAEHGCRERQNVFSLCSQRSPR